MARQNDRDVLIPIGDAQLDSAADEVVIDKLTARQLADLPEFKHVEITREEVLRSANEGWRCDDYGDRGTRRLSDFS